MYPVEIINKIKMQDAEAFRELANMYGKRMYLRLYEKSGNREIALEAVKEAFIELYVAIRSSQSSDVLESILYSTAEKKQEILMRREPKQIMDACINDLLTDKADLREKVVQVKVCEPVEIKTDVPEKKQENVASPISQEAPSDDADLIELSVSKAQSHGVGRGLAIAVLSVCAAAMLWVIAGLLMDMGFIPEADLGYAWFNANVTPWF